jgi:hypothetical protein
MRLELTIRASHLDLALTNTSDQQVRLWELHNSWGWFSISLEVRAAPDQAAEAAVIRRAPREWTKDGPTYFELAPDESRGVVLDLHDGWWVRDEALALDTRAPLWVRARLHIAPTPQSDELGVYTGTQDSDWVASQPPHNWLVGSHA